MALRTLSASNAAALDKELMSTGAFSIDQLMELAGLSVAQAVYKIHPPSAGKRVIVACGPGNNGGDGLVAARHLHYAGYAPSIFYPKRSKSDLYTRLLTQTTALKIPTLDSLPALSSSSEDTSTFQPPFDLLLDAIFGFSFNGPLRDPFPSVIAALAETKIPVLAVDAPSSWDIESGPPEEGPGKGYMPEYLISLTAPKPLVKWFSGRHFVGGRFLGSEIAERYGLDVPAYQGLEQVVEVPVDAVRL